MAEALPASGLRCRAGEVNRTVQVLVSGAILREVGFRTIVGPGLIGRHTADNGKAEQRHHHARTKTRESPHLTNSWETSPIERASASTRSAPVLRFARKTRAVAKVGDGFSVEHIRGVSYRIRPIATARRPFASPQLRMKSDGRPASRRAVASFSATSGFAFPPVIANITPRPV